jgi:hypothetical protein
VAFLACSGAQQGSTSDRGPGFVPQKSAPLIRLARSGTKACSVSCPSYSVEVDVEGGVTYAGVVNVKTIGPATGHLSPEAVLRLRTLMAKARQARISSDPCVCGCLKGAPQVSLTMRDGVPKTFEYEEGCEHTPHPIRVLESAVDELVGVEVWIGTIQQRRLCFEEQRDCSGFGTPEEPRPDGGR